MKMITICFTPTFVNLIKAYVGVYTMSMQDIT